MTPAGVFNSQFSWVGKAGAPGYGYAGLTSDLRPLNPYLGANAIGAAVPVASCPSDLASRSAAGVSTYDYYGTSYGQNQATENTTNVNYKFTLLEPNNRNDFGLKVTSLRGSSRVVTMAEAGAYHDEWTFAPPSVVVQRWHANTTRFNLLFADGHAAPHEVLRADKGATADYTFYWNK